MVSRELLLKIIQELNQRRANTSLALIGCILKGDKNSICSEYQDMLEFGTEDEKSLKNLGVVFDELINNKLIVVITDGLKKKYEITKQGYNELEAPSVKDKYYSSVGTASDYEEETERLKYTIDAIDKEIEDIEERKIDKTVGPGTVGMDYDDIQRIAEIKAMNERYLKIVKDLQRIKENPYFGRMDLIEIKNENIKLLQHYIGYNSLVIGGINLVIDWRSKIAGYYNHDLYSFELEKGKYELLLKRRIQLENRKVKDIYNIITKRKTELKDTISDPFLVNVLKKKKDSIVFTDIIATIQEKQNEIIRQPLQTNLVVQGCAGSGKTMILLHRLSYLLFHHKKMNTERIKIITPGDLFDAFISDLSEQLDVSKIERQSMIQLYLSHINQHYPIIKSSNFKSESSIDKDILEVLYSKEFLASLVGKIQEQVKIDVENIKLKMKSSIDNEYKEYLDLVSEIESLIKTKLQVKIKGLSNYLKNDKNFSHLLTIEKIKQFGQKIAEAYNLNHAVEMKITETQTMINIEIAKLRFLDEIIDENFVQTLSNKANSYKIKLFSSDKVSTESYLIEYKDTLKRSIEEKVHNYSKVLNSYKKELINNEDLKKYNKASKFYTNEIEPILMEISEKKSRFQNFSNAQLTYERNVREVNQQIEELQSYVLDMGSNKNDISKFIQGLGFKTAINLDINQYFQSIAVDEIEKIFENANIKIRYHNQYKYFYYLKLAVLVAFGFSFDQMDLIMIDEAQEFSSTEYLLLKEIHKEAHFNYYGDIKQRISHIGLRGWDVLREKAKYYELNENYRNPKPIVQYVNKELNMNMNPLGLEEGQIFFNNMPEIEKINAILFAHEDREEFINNSKIPKGVADSNSYIHIEDARGLEFNTVTVFTQNMNENQKYIAYSRALENLIVVHEKS